MTKADSNLLVIENFILHITHCSSEQEADFKEPITFTPELLYKMAEEYIEEDHVDGRDNKENNIDLLKKITPEEAKDMKVILDFLDADSELYKTQIKAMRALGIEP